MTSQPTAAPAPVPALLAPLSIGLRGDEPELSLLAGKTKAIYPLGSFADLPLLTGTLASLFCHDTCGEGQYEAQQCGERRP